MPRYPQKSKSDALENCQRQIAEWSKSRKRLNNCYVIEKEPLGRGGFGLIYKAKDVVLNRPVVAKVLFDVDNPKKRRQFYREATTLANLRHRALPVVLGYFTEGKWQFVILQFIEGEDFGKLLKREGKFKVEKVVFWYVSLLDALNYMHSQKHPIIHLDISPSNIILANGEVTLLDFGLVRGVPDSRLLFSETLSQTSGISGFTLPYAPLEQVLPCTGACTAPKSDIYSLSATAYHLVTGLKPVSAADRWFEFQRGGRDPLLPAHKVDSDIPLQLSELLSKGVAINLEDRPSAAEMRIMLMQVLAEIAKPGREMEEILRRLNNEESKVISKSTGADNGSSEPPVSSVDIKNDDSRVPSKAIEVEVQRPRKETRKPEEEAVQREAEAKAKNEDEEAARRKAEEKARQPARKPVAKVPIAPMKRKRLRPIMTGLIAACLILIISATIIRIYIRSKTSQPVTFLEAVKPPQPVPSETVSVSIKDNGSTDNQDQRKTGPQTPNQPSKDIPERGNKYNSNEASAAPKGVKKSREIAKKKPSNGKGRIPVVASTKGNRGRSQSALGTGNPSRHPKETVAGLRGYGKSRRAYRDPALRYIEARINAGNSEARSGHYGKALKRYNEAGRACKKTAHCEPDIVEAVNHNRGIIHALIHGAAIPKRPNRATNNKRDTAFRQRTGAARKQYKRKAVMRRTPPLYLTVDRRRHSAR